MGGRISDTAIEEVRSRINIVELVSERTALKRRGRNHVGLCPFHAENTPSFTVSEERSFFHCFGCGASGDAFAWIMRLENVSFPEAARLLAARAGVALPAAGRGGGDRRDEDRLFEINEQVATYYRRVLWEHPGGAAARAYLESRGLDEALAKHWELGHAPGSGDGLVRWLRSRGVPVEGALAVGLVGRRADGSLFDRFRDRIVFPIRDDRGRIAGFGGRVLPERQDDAPKYLNSSDSAIFKKGHLVYGLRQARDAIRGGRAVVVEGYFDVLALHQGGVVGAVAPLGTALTVDQLRTIRRYTDDIVACFDGDEAGRRAAARSFAAFVEAGLWGRAAFLPGGEDPDSFVRSRGAEAFEHVLRESRPLLDVFLEGLLAADEPSVGRRVTAAREVSRLLRRVRNPWEYDVLARRAAERLGVGEALIRGEGSPAVSSAAAPVAGARRGVRATSEALLVELMLTWPAAVERIVREGGPVLFDDAEWRSLAEEIIERVRGGADPSMLIERLPADMRSRVAAALLQDAADSAASADSADREQLLEDCVAFIRRRRGRRRVREALEEIRAAEAAGDQDRVRRGLRDWSALVRAEGDAGLPDGGGSRH
jgi:DNA primase